VTSYELTHFQNGFIKTMSHDHLVQMAYDEGLVAVRYFQDNRKVKDPHTNTLVSMAEMVLTLITFECKGEYCKLRGWRGNG